MRFAIIVLLCVTTGRRSLSASTIGLARRRLQPNPNTTEAPTIPCQDELNAIFICFASSGLSEEQAHQCDDCGRIHTPEDPTCEEVEIAMCLALQECPCGTCGPEIIAHSYCELGGVCDPITCPTVPSSPVTPQPGSAIDPTTPAPASCGGTLPIWLSSVLMFVIVLLGAIF